MRQKFKSMLLTISFILSANTAMAQGPGKRAKVIDTTPQHVLIAGDSNQSITVGGMQRSYILHIPAGYHGSARLPLVFVLHGMGGTGESIAQKTGMSAKADQENFIVVYPNGVGHPIVWNVGLSDISNNGADDVGFIRAVMDKLEHDLRIDRNRIYCCGFSSGAIMSYLLGAQLSHRLAAIGIASGTVGNTASGPVRMIPDPSEPVPVIAFHGQQDHTIYYNGGGKFANLPVADSIAFWVKADGCASPPQKTTRQQGNLTIDDYDSCRDGSEVVLYTFVNGTHEWPTLQNNDQLSATDSIWKFFVKHARK